MKNVNSEQRALVTVIERIDVLEERVVLLELDYEDLRKDNNHLRQRLDQTQEANYLLECDVRDEHKKVLRLEANSALMKFKVKQIESIVECFKKWMKNWNTLGKRIMEAGEDNA